MMTFTIPPSTPAVAKPVKFSVTQSIEKNNTPVTQADSFQKTEALSAQARSGSGFQSLFRSCLHSLDSLFNNSLQ
jgi:hypothetical protein